MTNGSIKLKIGPVEIEIPTAIESWLRRPRPRATKRQLKSLSRWLARESGLIKLKVISYTGQSTFRMIETLFSQSHDVLENRNVEIQVLRPSLQKPLRIWDMDKTSDKAYWESVRTIAEQLDSFWLRIAEQWPEKLDVKIRTHPFEPNIKGILLNDKIGLVGFYALKTHTKEKPHKVTAWDYIGYMSEMSEFRISDKELRGYLFERALSYFDNIWRHFSTAVVMKS